MKISVLGMGYVGLSNATMLSTKYDVICHDIDESKLESIEKRRSPIKDKLISRKVLYAGLSGSGSTVYGIFNSKEDAQFASSLFPSYKTYLTSSIA